MSEAPDTHDAARSAPAQPASFPRPPVVPVVLADPDPDILPGLSPIGPIASERKVRDWALVLQSMSVWHVTRRSFGGWVLLVRDEDHAAALRSIESYEAENRDWPPRPARERMRHAASTAIPVMFALLTAFFLITGPESSGSFWFARGASISDRVLSTQPWRAVTALTLHADAVHVLGNAVSGTVFVSAVQRRIGAGAAALTVLAAGAAGNLANALYHTFRGHAHASIGASTAVFGAIGLLAATQLVVGSRSHRPRTWLDIASPIVGGFALLGALGSGGQAYDGFGSDMPVRNTTDLGAHLFGLLAGLLIGLVVAIPLRRSSAGAHGHDVSLGEGAPRWWVQTTLGALAAAIIVVSWQMALRWGR